MYRLTLLAVLAIMSSGCAVSQAHNTQDQMRATLLDLYTDQVMDNLVRAHNRVPIIQLDYTQAQGMITVKNTAGLGNMNTSTTTRVTAIPAFTQMFTRTATNVFNATLGLENTNQITIAATPVTTLNEVYDAYLQYLSIEDSLIESAEPPPAGAAHICRKYCNTYYWVPVSCRDKFFELALLSTAQRGKSLLPAPAYLEVNVVDVLKGSVPVGVEQPPPSPSGGTPSIQPPDGEVKSSTEAQRITLVLDKKIGNDSGYLIIPDLVNAKSEDLSSELRKATFVFGPYDKQVDNPAKSQNPLLASTDRLEVNIDKATADNLRVKANLNKVLVRVYLQHSAPKPPTTEELLQRANFQLQQFNQNIVR
jgi:hypothetical protein